MDQTYDRLEMPVEDALADHRASRVIPSVRKDETLESVFKMLLSTRKHACIVVDEEEKAKGIISLSDIFQLVLHASNVQVESKS
jgi:CBS domain-containing protein